MVPGASCLVLSSCVVVTINDGTSGDVRSCSGIGSCLNCESASCCGSEFTEGVEGAVGLVGEDRVVLVGSCNPCSSSSSGFLSSISNLCIAVKGSPRVVPFR